MLVREDSHEEKPWFLAWMSIITSEMDFTHVLFPLQTMVHTMVRVIFGICKYMTILVSWLISSVASWLPITLKIKTQILARNDQELQNLHLFILGIPFLLYWLPCSVILSPCRGKGSPHEALYLCHLNGSQSQFQKLHGEGERKFPKERWTMDKIAHILFCHIIKIKLSCI